MLRQQDLEVIAQQPVDAFGVMPSACTNEAFFGASSGSVSANERLGSLDLVFLDLT